jgi:superfamily I DNA and/or RNA helicase
MVVGLMDMPSKVYYNDCLVNGAGTKLEDRSNAQLFKRFILDVFHMDSSRLYMNVAGSGCSIDPTTKSRFNVRNAHAVMEYLTQMLQYGLEGKDIISLTPYQAQYDIYRLGLLSLKKDDPNAKDIRVRKIDGFQGSEAPYVIFDTVITIEAGFTTDANRLNVAMTRCKDGLIVVGNSDAIWQITIIPEKEIHGQAYRFLWRLPATPHYRSRLHLQPPCQRPDWIYDGYRSRF